MYIFFQRHRKVVMLAGVILLAIVFFVPLARPAHAGLFSFGDVANTFFKSAYLAFIGFFTTLINGILVVVVWFMQWAIKPGPIPDAIKQSWIVMRNFVNLFFVLSLIVMAAGTIFEFEKYSFKNLFPKFLIAALLINFSFVIGEYVYNISNGLGTLFLNQIETASKTDMVTNLGRITQAGKIQNLDLHSATTNSTLGSATNLVINSAGVVVAPVMVLVEVAIQLLFLIGILLGFLVVTLYLFIRIIVIWFLLLVSPLAFLGLMFPNMKASTWDRWWSALFSWCFSFPAYIFFLTFAVMFFAGHTQAATAMANDPSRTFVGLFFEDILYYLVALFFLFYGLFTSHSIAKFSGSGVGQVFQWTQNRIKNRGFRGVTYNTVTGAGKATFDQFLEEGAPGKLKFLYAGGKQQKRDLTKVTQGLKQAIGYRSFEGEENYNADAQKYFSELEEDYKNGYLTPEGLIKKVAQYTDKNDPHWLAVQKMLAATGQMDAASFDKTKVALGTNTTAVNDLTKALRESSALTSRGDEIYNGLVTDYQQDRLKPDEIRRRAAQYTNPASPYHYAYAKLRASIGDMSKTELDAVRLRFPNSPVVRDGLLKTFRERPAFMQTAKVVYEGAASDYLNDRLTVQDIRDKLALPDNSDPNSYGFFAYNKALAATGSMTADELKDALTKLDDNPLAKQDIEKTARESSLYMEKANRIYGNYKFDFDRGEIKTNDIANATGLFSDARYKDPKDPKFLVRAKLGARAGIFDETMMRAAFGKNGLESQAAREDLMASLQEGQFKKLQWNEMPDMVLEKGKYAGLGIPTVGKRQMLMWMAGNSVIMNSRDEHGNFKIGDADFDTIVDKMGGIQSVAMEKWIDTVKIKRPDLNVSYEKRKIADRKATRPAGDYSDIGKTAEDLVEMLGLEMGDIAKLSPKLWDDKIIIKKLWGQMRGAKKAGPQEYQRYLSRMDEAVRNSKGDTVDIEEKLRKVATLQRLMELNPNYDPTTAGRVKEIIKI